MLARDKYRGTSEYAKARAKLIRLARAKSLIIYKDLARVADLPLVGNNMAREVGLVLDPISRDEVGEGRPMLSALVVKKPSRESIPLELSIPGPGFFDLARSLGRLQAQDEDSFWEAERDAVYEVWAEAGS